MMTRATAAAAAGSSRVRTGRLEAAAAAAAAVVAEVAGAAAAAAAGAGAGQAAGAQPLQQPAHAQAAARQQQQPQQPPQPQRDMGPQWTVCLGRLRIRGRLGPALAVARPATVALQALRPTAAEALGKTCCPYCGGGGSSGGGGPDDALSGCATPGDEADADAPDPAAWAAHVDAFLAAEAAAGDWEEAEEEARWQALLGLTARRRLVVSQLTAPLQVAPRRLAMLLLRLAAPVEKLELRLPLTEAEPALLAFGPGAPAPAHLLAGAGGSGSGGSGPSGSGAGGSDAGGSGAGGSSSASARGPMSAAAALLVGCAGGAASCHVARALGSGHVACRDWSWPPPHGAESDSDTGESDDDSSDADSAEDGEGVGGARTGGDQAGGEGLQAEGPAAARCRCRGCRWGSDLTAALQLLPLGYGPHWRRLVVAP
ncbi:hypothetical protein HXX76_012928 [Chlamydomonas incerta]|uniref:Uncharacterized protein n=1 Tax=Chlamydomonas incerta TaxID=51695 RepID=A0A835VUS0_CHLIN|nr:hypothetical protein HXX76_012928 [Chlamydomonas incerta]|eukprot:KAG2426613.1 hypothetical protein HXX76_012928 [Chlamydomonas incerta]